MTDLRQTKEYAEYLRCDGWIVERVDGVNYFIRKMPIIGAVLKIQRPEEIRYRDIEILSEKYKVFQAIIEPKDENQAQIVQKLGFKLAKSTFLPSKTLLIDLTKSQKEISKEFKRNIKKGIKKSEEDYSPERVTTLSHGRRVKRVEGEWPPLTKEYSTPEEIKKFRDVWKNSVNSRRHVPSLESLLNLRKSFPGKKSLFLASHNISGRIIGGVIFTVTLHGVSNYIISYMYGFSSAEGRSSLSMASLLYQGILWGKKIGCKIFDFEGLYDSRFPNKDWLGFTRFKKSFGGYEVLYPGCYNRFRWPF